MSVKTIILLAIFGICIQSLHAQVCSDPLNTIYGVTQNGDIVPINVNDASIDPPITSSGDPGYPGPTSNANAMGLIFKAELFIISRIMLQAASNLFRITLHPIPIPCLQTAQSAEP